MLLGSNTRSHHNNCYCFCLLAVPVESSVLLVLGVAYEKVVFDTLQNHKHVWIKKATGLGITELMLRYMSWLCLRDDSLKGSQMCIVTGPRIGLAIELIKRMKSLFLIKILQHLTPRKLSSNLMVCTYKPIHHTI